MSRTKYQPKRKPLTPEAYQERFEAVANEQFNLKTPYEHSRQKILIEHQLCFKTFERMPLQFLLNATCPHCTKRKPRKSEGDFLKELEEKQPGRYRLEEPLINMMTIISVKHLSCGHIHPHRPIDLLLGPRCKTCRPLLTKSDETFRQEVQDLVGDEYEPLEAYQHSLAKLSMLHRKCQKTYKVTPTAFLKGNRCPHCSSKKRALSPEDYAKAFNARHENRFILKSQYEGAAHKVWVEHAECGHRYLINASRVLNQPHRCPKCKTRAS